MTEGDRVRIILHSKLPESTTVHWHGIDSPQQNGWPSFHYAGPIRSGDSYTYEFTAEQAGTFFYHSHGHLDRQQGLGLCGALIIDPKDKGTEPKADLE